MAAEKTEQNVIDQKLLDFSWMIRPCEVYEDEYSDCRSIKSRFHQYFVHGHTTDCNGWKRDIRRCEKWVEDRDPIAYKELLESEEQRRRERLKPHVENDVWKRRVHPPSNWNAPLPAWLEEQNKGSFLAVKAEEIRTHGKALPGERTLCVIS